MKSTKLFMVCIVIILVISITFIHAEDIDWGDSDSWTAENVQKDPEGAIKADPQKAFDTNPNAVVDYLSGGNVQFEGSAGDVKINGKVLSNTNGPSIDISNFPAGTKIKPNGKNGFIVQLPESNNIAISGETSGKAINFDKNSKRLRIGDKSFLSIKGNHVSSVKIGKDGIFQVVMDNKQIGIKPASRGVSINDNTISLSKGDRASLSLDKKWTIVGAHDTTKINSIGKGFEVKGKFVAHFDTKYGVVSVPSMLESASSKTKLFDTGDLTLELKTGKPLTEERTVMWDGKELSAKGEVSFSILKNNNEIIQAGGVVKGVEFSATDKGMMIKSKPDADIMRDSIIKEITNEEREYTERLDSINNKIKNLNMGTPGSEAELALLKSQKEIITKRLNELPQANFDTEDDSEYYKGYLKKDLDARPASLVVVVNAKDNAMFANVINYKAGNEKYEIVSNKVNLFSEGTKTTLGKLNYEYSFSVPQKQGLFSSNMEIKEKWRLVDGELFGVDDGELSEPVPFYSNINVKLDDNGVRFSGDVSGVFSDAAKSSGGAVGYLGSKAVKQALDGVDFGLLDVKVDKQNNLLTMSNDFSGELSKIKPAKVMGFDVTNKLKDALPENVAKTLKEEIYVRKESDLSIVSDMVDKIKDNNILDERSAVTLKKGLTQSFRELRTSKEFYNLKSYSGIEVQFKQLDSNNAVVSVNIKGLDIKDEPVNVELSPVRINTNNVNIVNMFANRLNDISKKRSLVEIYNLFIEE